MADTWSHRMRWRTPGYIRRVPGTGRPFRQSIASPSANYATFTAQLLDGVTVRGTWDVISPAEWTTDTITLTSAERDAISNWADLSIKITADGSQIAVSQLHLSAVVEDQLDVHVALYQGATFIGSWPIYPYKSDWAVDYLTLTTEQAESLTASASTVSDLSVIVTADGVDAVRVSHLYLDGSETPAATVETTALLLQGATTIASVDYISTASETNAVLTLTDQQMSTLTVASGAVSNLKIKLIATGTGGTATRVTQAYAQVAEKTPPGGGGGGLSGFWRATAIPYSPGFYILVNPDAANIDTEIDATFDEASDSAYIDGIAWRQNWNEVDTGTSGASYDWSKIDAALARVKYHATRLGRPLKFVIDITPKTFTTGNVGITPTWLKTAHPGDPGVTFSYNASMQTTCAIVWDRGTAASNAVRAAWFALWAAFASRYESDASWFGWACTHESASSMVPGQDGYTHDLFFAYMADLVARWRQSSAVFPWLMQINYPASKLAGLVTACINNTVFLGGPDIKIGGAQENASYDVFRTLNGALPVFHDVQWSNYQTLIGGSSSYQSITDIINYCSGIPVGAWANPMRLQALNFRDRDNATPIGVPWPGLILPAIQAARDAGTFPQPV